MKKYRKTITVIIILIVAVLMFGSFFGTYVKNKNGERIKILPDFKLGMEFGNTTLIKATVNNEVITTIYDAEGNIVNEEEGVEYTEEKGYTTVNEAVNEESKKTVENYKLTKKIMEERLEKNNISEFFVNLNKETGEIDVRIPESLDAQEVQSILSNSGSFLLLDGETFETVFDNTYLKNAQVAYRQGDVETAVVLQLSFNEEGKQKLKELNEIYKEWTEEQVQEDGTTQTVTNSKTVWVFLNNSFLGSTVLSNIYYNDTILLTYGLSSNNEELLQAVEEAEKDAILLNSGSMPLAYNFTNEVEETNINSFSILVFIAAISVVFLIAYIYLIIKYKARGFIAIYFQIGFLAILLLILRLIGTVITMEGIAGIIISMILEYIFTYIVLKHMETEEEKLYSKANLEFFLNTFPIYIISVVFTFGKRVNISSFGMAIFWGIIVIYIYNFIFCKYIFENLSGGKNENN